MESKKKSLLVVDDDDSLRKAIVFDFMRKGYEVLEARNGEEAFELVKTKPVDIVITDYHMPGGDGVALLKRLKELDAGARVVFFLTDSSDMTAEEVYDLGASAVFSKPFDRKALFAAVEKTLADLATAYTPRAERVAADLKIEMSLNVLGDSLGDGVNASLFNIGRGGAFVVLDSSQLPRIGAAVAFKITFSLNQGSVLVEGDGIVRWVRTEAIDKLPIGCGIEFLSLSDRSRAGVVEIINALKTSAYIPKQ